MGHYRKRHSGQPSEQERGHHRQTVGRTTWGVKIFEDRVRWKTTIPPPTSSMSSRQPSSSSSKTKAAATGRRRKKANSVTIAAKEAELAALEAALAEIDKDDQQKEQIKQLALETKQDRQGRKLGILPKAKGRAETGGKEPEDDPMDVERPKVHGSGELGAGEARLQR